MHLVSLRRGTLPDAQGGAAGLGMGSRSIRVAQRSALNRQSTSSARICLRKEHCQVGAFWGQFGLAKPCQGPPTLLSCVRSLCAEAFCAFSLNCRTYNLLSNVNFLPELGEARSQTRAIAKTFNHLHKHANQTDGK